MRFLSSSALHYRHVKLRLGIKYPCNDPAIRCLSRPYMCSQIGLVPFEHAMHCRQVQIWVHCQTGAASFNLDFTPTMLILCRPKVELTVTHRTWWEGSHFWTARVPFNFKLTISQQQHGLESRQKVHSQQLLAQLCVAQARP